MSAGRFLDYIIADMITAQYSYNQFITNYHSFSLIWDISSGRAARPLSATCWPLGKETEHYGHFFIFPFPQVPPDLLKIFHLFYSLHFLIELIKKIF